MANETFKKRQKEMARREKKKKKFERRMERKAEKAKSEAVTEENLKTGPLDIRRGPTIL